MALIVDIKVSISSDAKKLVIEDDSTGWGTPARTDIDSSLLVFYTDEAHTDEIGRTTALLPTVSDEIDFNSTDGGDTLSQAFITEFGSYLPDGLIYYEVEYFDGAVSQGSKTDGVIYSTRIIEGNINSDLLDFLTGIKAYNYRMNFPRLEEIRRRDNILFAIESAEFLSEAENVENLIDFLERLE